MRPYRLALGAVLLGGLSACAAAPAVLGALGSAGSVYTAVNNVTSVAAPLIAKGCAEYQTARAAANAVLASGLVPASSYARVVSIEQFGDAACANPPAGDPVSTVVWLGTLVGQIGTLTKG